MAADLDAEKVKETAGMIAKEDSKAICFPVKTDVSDSAEVEKVSADVWGCFGADFIQHINKTT